MICASVSIRNFGSVSRGVESHVFIAFRSFHASTRSNATKRRAWSSSDDAKFTEMWERGTSLKDMAASLERSFSSVRFRRHALGLPSRHCRFSEEEDSRLREAKARGLKWEQIVDLFPSRPRDSLLYRWQMYLSEGSQGSKGSIPKGQPFTEDEKNRLLRLRNVQKLGWIQLQECMPERGMVSLRSHYHRLMGDKPRPAVTKGLKSFQYRDRIQKLVSEGRTAAEIASLTGLSISHVGSLRRMVKAPMSNIRSQRMWTDDEIEQAKSLKKHGKAHVEIANQLGRSYMSILKLFWRLKHSKKAFSVTEEAQKPMR